MSQPAGSVRVLIATYLEDEHVQRIATADPRVTVLYAPDLLPTPRYQADHNGIRRPLTAQQEAAWTELLAQADVAFDFDWRDPAALPATAPNLRWIQATSSGIGEFLLATGLINSQIVFTTAAGVHSAPLAEFACLGLLYLVKQVPLLRARQAEHRWERYTARSIEGLRVLVVGTGQVGTATARYLTGLGASVRTASRHPRPPSSGTEPALPLGQLKEALRETDAIVLACPLSPETYHLIAAAELAAMPPGGYLVNIGRGPVVDQPALVEALASSHLGGAVIDVAEEEPLPADSPLWDLPNVLISPHSASTVASENGKITDLFIDNLYRWLDGRPLSNVFRPSDSMAWGEAT
ncbi:MAG: D-2-hydroxyacid dehydrogenase [Bifidobacteriaceae bacterium]|nr:D-2-hydroxyacid dehydrogenase [Bifidobacteriaceae bacterium]